MIDYVPLQRPPEAFQVPVSLVDLLAMCRRAFGQGVPIRSLREIGGGQFNTTYFVQGENREPVVLRVAPPARRCSLWHETNLMQRELEMQTFLSPFNSLLPRILVADFTHQIVDRDYLFQTFLPGESWTGLPDDLSLHEHDVLWREFARLVKAISQIQGETFGLVQGGPQFSTWSSTLLDWLERTLADAQRSKVDTTSLQQLLSLVQRNTVLFDHVTQPRLLHGDLWWFNLLIERNAIGLHISGMLDADRGAWGDPLADWTFFLLPRRASPYEQALFWEEYGLPEQDTAACFRAKVYEGLHQGKILSVATRDRKEKVVLKAEDALKHIVHTLQSILAG